MEHKMSTINYVSFAYKAVSWIEQLGKYILNSRNEPEEKPANLYENDRKKKQRKKTYAHKSMDCNKTKI